MTPAAPAETSAARHFWLAGPGRDVLVLLILALIALVPRLVRIESAPPGLNGDELFNAIDALRLGPGHWQSYFEGNNGREALFLYLMAGPLRLFGQHIWAVRLPAVLLGTGVVLLAYGLGALAFNRRIGFVAGLLIAVSLWPVMHARWGLRAVSLTFFTALTIYLYLFALRRSAEAARQRGKSLGAWIAAGLALGMTMYTYIPARVFPLVILAWFAWIALTRRTLFGRIWRRLLLSLLAALLLFAPFGLYMIRHPDKVNQRIESLEGANSLEQALEGDATRLLRATASVALMFTFQGDPAARYHYDAQPVFDPLTGLFFYLGLATTIWLAFRLRPESDRRSSYGLLLLWMAAMLAPNIVVGANSSFLRGAGAIVPIFLIAAIGLDSVYRWFCRRWPGREGAWRLAFASLVAVGALFILLETWGDYFGGWVNDDEVRQVYRAGLARIGEYLDENQPPPGTQLFIAYDYVAETTPQEFVYYSDRGAIWFDNDKAFGWRPGESPAWYFISEDKPLAPAALSRLEAGARGETVTYDNGDEAFTLYRLEPAGLNWRPEQEAYMEFVDGPALIGFDLPENLNRGEKATIVLHWQIPENRQGLPNRLSYAQLFLEDESGNVWQRAETLLGYPEAGWQTGDRFVSILNLDIPPGIPPGPVYFRFGLRDWQGEPYARDPSGNQTAARSGPYLMRAGPAGELTLSPDATVFDGELALIDYALSSQIAPGLATAISLDWLALETPTDDYRVQLQLTEGLEGDVFYSENHAIWPGTYPPTQWVAGEQVTSFHQLQVPLDLPDADNPWLHIQLLPSEDDIALPLSQGADVLTELTVDRRDHLFDLPDISHPLDARFGEQIALLGYDLTTSSSQPGGALEATLYWQAIDTPPAGYTVFNHLVGEDDQIHGQFDGPPSGDAWFTGGWLPGEIIIDRRTIPIDADAPTGPYTLFVGLYTSGDDRLPAYLDGELLADDRLPLARVEIRP